MIVNTQGKIFYGIHFYPGVARYVELDDQCLFINEDTIRSMDPTFAGCPVFVEHVDEVDPNIDELRKEADGWVIESFFNAADGKHWVKFIITSEKGARAIESGFRLSNSYMPKSYGKGGLWNGVPYVQEVLAGEFHHLALVSSPRYEESVVMTPEQFKKYNDDKAVELKRLANSKDKSKEKEKMGLKFNLFKRTKTKVENALDGDTVIELADGLKDKKGAAISKEVSFEALVNSYTAVHNMHGYANGDHMVKVGEDEMSVNDLVKKHMEMCNSEKERLEKENSDDGMDMEDCANADDEETTDEEDEEDVGDRGGEGDVENADEEEEGEKKDKKSNAKDATKLIAKKKADAIKNAHLRQFRREEPQILELTSDKVERGKLRYGPRH